MVSATHPAICDCLSQAGPQRRVFQLAVGFNEGTSTGTSALHADATRCNTKSRNPCPVTCAHPVANQATPTTKRAPNLAPRHRSPCTKTPNLAQSCTSAIPPDPPSISLNINDLGFDCSKRGRPVPAVRRRLYLQAERLAQIHPLHLRSEEH